MDELDDAESSRALACVLYPSGVVTITRHVMKILRVGLGTLGCDKCEGCVEGELVAASE